MLKRFWSSVFLLVGVFLSSGGGAAVLVVDCDGDGQFTDIGGAVEAAQDGDTIVVHECRTMPFSYPPFAVDSKFDLHVIAGDQTVVGGAGSTAIGVGVAVGSFNPFVSIAGSGDCVTITNSTRILLKGFELDQCGEDGVSIDSSSNVGIVGNKILGAGGDGVRDESSDGSYINGNIIGQSTGSGVALSNSIDARIIDNLIGLNGDAQGGQGVSVTSSSPVSESVQVGDLSGGALANSIVNNTIVENPGGCIFDAGGDTKIESNTCSGANVTPRTIFVDAAAFGGEIVANIGIIDDPFMNSDESDNCPTAAPC